MNYFTLILNTSKVSKLLKSLLTNMSTTQIEFIPRDVAEFYINEIKDKITLSEKMIFDPANGSTICLYEFILNDTDDITNENKYSVGKTLKGLYYIKDKKSGKRIIESCDSSNDDLTIDSYRNQDNLLNYTKSSAETSNVSIAETSIESFSKSETESIDKTIDIDLYSKIVKNNLPQSKEEENKHEKKICSLKLTKNDIHIDKLCQIFIDHINTNLAKYKYYISKDIHSIVYCLTGMEDIKNQLKLEYENNNFWVDNIKKTRFITSINDQLEKEDLKISVGQSLNNDKWTIVILHHIDNTKPSFKNINKNLNKIKK